MPKLNRLLLAGVILLAAAPAYAADAGLDGIYKLVYYSGTNEVPWTLLKFETKDGKLQASIVDEGRFGVSGIKQVAVDGKTVRFHLDGQNAGNFEGIIAKDEVPGSLQIGASLLTTNLIKTSDEKLQQAPTQLKVPEFTKANQEAMKVARLQTQARREKDAEKKAGLRKQVEEAKEKAAPEEAKLYREVLAKYPDSPVVVAAFTALVRNDKAKPTPEEAAKWLATVSQFAAKHGARLTAETKLQVADALAGNKDLKALALEKAKMVDSALPENASLDEKMRVKKILRKALETGGKADELKAVESTIAEFDKVLDAEYLAKVPPFKAEPFAGRKEKGERKVVMELFTGAQCPPCVAADVAFDALSKSYKPSELILLQYHLHIPGPDPMTNSDTEGRAAYYQINSTPSTRFNGKSPLRPGGGGMGAAEGLFGRYQKVIQPILEENEDAKLVVKATRTGDKININADISGIENPDAKKRLRFVLVEEIIPYVGGNKLRFHHHVVRDLPGGVEGFPIKESKFHQSVTVNLDELRSKLNKYLDTYVKENEAEFASRRPALDFKHLKVVGLVQDDDTKEILQVIQADIEGEVAASVR
jgi:hypothetical protein